MMAGIFLSIKTPMEKHRYLYSNRLEKTDKVPPGGIRKPLREKEKQIQKELNSNLRLAVIIQSWIL